MKLSAFPLLVIPCLSLAKPIWPVQERADFCGQWDTAVAGTYTVYNNLWGQSGATSGWQCSGIDGLSGSTLQWHTSWTWVGGYNFLLSLASSFTTYKQPPSNPCRSPWNVKSYTNVGTKFSPTALSSLTPLPSTWTWSYTGSSLVANVAYDLFTATTPSGTPEYEIMVWLSALGGAGPLSATGKPIATVTLAGSNWNLWYGKNGAMKVFSYVAVGNIMTFKGDLRDFVSYLVAKQGLPGTQILQRAGAGTEVFTGKDARLVTSEYSFVQS